MGTPSCQVHRFRDRVALFVGDGSTTYFTPKEARAIAKQLNNCAKDVLDKDSLSSQFVTWELYRDSKTNL